METLAVTQTETIKSEKIQGLQNLIAAIGRREFEARLLSFLNLTCGAEYCATFQLDNGIPLEASSVSLDGTDAGRKQVRLYVQGKYWKRDPMLAEARRLSTRPHPSIVRLAVNRLADSDLRDLIYGPTHVCERLLLCGGSSSTTLGLSILRSEKWGMFEANEISRLGCLADTILSILAKHNEVTRPQPDLTLALTSLEVIESSIVDAPERFPRREAEVCARMILGQSCLGTAIELGIGEQTVLTYRKRIYQRLSICSQRELFLWYVNLWSGERPGFRELRPPACLAKARRH